jgi:hypothetical protein
MIMDTTLRFVDVEGVGAEIRRDNVDQKSRRRKGYINQQEPLDSWCSNCHGECPRGSRECRFVWASCPKLALASECSFFALFPQIPRHCGSPLVPSLQSYALGYYWRGNHGSSLVLGLRMITIQDPTTTHDIYISHTLIIYCLTGSMHRYSQLSID